MHVSFRKINKWELVSCNDKSQTFRVPTDKGTRGRKQEISEVFDRTEI